MKNLIKKLKTIITRTKVFDIIYFGIFRRYLKMPKNWYKESDEKFKFIHILEAINYVKVSEIPKVYFEFGCHSGRTFSAALSSSKYLGLDLKAFAFDSFEGLPNTNKYQDGIFKKGTFYTGMNDFKNIVFKKTGIKLNNNQLIKGYYENSLNKSLKNKLPDKVGFVHIDVDLYSSTKTVLEFIKDFLVEGTVILFDDWYCFPPGKNLGEKRAVKEFLIKYPNIELEEWKNYSTFGKSFFVTKI